MDKLAFIIGSILLLNLLTCNAQTSPSSTSDPVSTTPEPLDCAAGGKHGNPGAFLRMSPKGLDFLYDIATKKIAMAVKKMVIPDVIVPIAGGMLTIKGTRVHEAKFEGHQRRLIPSNRVRSRFHGGRIVSIGQWQYRPINGVTRTVSNGIFRTIVVNPEMNITSQLSRTWDAKPVVDVKECKGYLAEFRVEVEGFGDNMTVIDQCDNLMCKRIRSYFEDAICNSARCYVKDSLNPRLSTAPARINLGPSGTGNRFVLDYGLLMNEPKVTDKYIQSYLEGEVLARGSASAPFHANVLSMPEDDQNDESFMTFLLSDYIFNSLLHHAHSQQFRFSAYDLVPESSAVRDGLKFQCGSDSGAPVRGRPGEPGPPSRPGEPGPPGVPPARGLSSVARPAQRAVRRGPAGPSRMAAPARGKVPICLGSVFENYTMPDGSVNDMGDLVFKSQRPLQLILDNNITSTFGVNGGSLEAYGPVGSDGKREFLGRADVKWMRGTFVPKICECNVTGCPSINELKLALPAPDRLRRRSLDESTLPKLTELASALLSETFKSFFDQYAQFPIPLVDGYACDAPALVKWGERTMHVNTNLRVIPDVTREGKQP